MNIIKPRREIELELPQRTVHSNEAQFVLRDLNGRELYRSPWTKNLITDYGLDNLASVYGYILRIGTGTTPPSVSDTALANYLTEEQRWGTEFEPEDINPPYERYMDSFYRFPSGTSGLITEAGKRHGAPELFTRLLLDTPIQKNTDNILDVTYRDWISVDPTPVTNRITLDGEDYDIISKPANIDEMHPNNTVGLIASYYNQSCHAGDFNEVWLSPVAGGLTGPSYCSWFAHDDYPNITDVVTEDANTRSVQQIWGWHLDSAVGTIRSIFWNGSSCDLQCQIEKVSNPSVGFDKTNEMLFWIITKSIWGRA